MNVNWIWTTQLTADDGLGGANNSCVRTIAESERLLRERALIANSCPGQTTAKGERMLKAKMNTAGERPARVNEY